MIRRGTTNDVELLAHIGKTTFDDTFGNTCTRDDMRGVLDRFFNSTQCAMELADEADNFFFYEEEGVAKGYMRIHAKHVCPLRSFQNQKCIELVRLYVLKEYHGAV
ncbi:MAG: caspase family protein [Bacteroidetes bacterium]|nr:caspase family protein [Bacteroidota bacterium]